MIRARGAALALACSLMSAPLGAQEGTRRIEAELSASLFFGNTEQTLALMRTAVERSDSSHALRSELRFNYGETEDDAGDRHVSRRSWLGTLNFDWRPLDAQSQFVLAMIEA